MTLNDYLWDQKHVDTEADILRKLVIELKQTTIVTLGGKGGAYEYLEKKILALADSIE